MLKIISGGQTGVDRGALDAALELGIECGGWCPAGRLAEDGIIPERYPVSEMLTSDYSARTRQNVMESDGTLIISNGELSGGTLETFQFCRKERKPHTVIDSAIVAADDAVKIAQKFIARNGINVLNVAGPRASQWPAGQEFTQRITSGFLSPPSGHKSADEYSV